MSRPPTRPEPLTTAANSVVCQRGADIRSGSSSPAGIRRRSRNQPATT
ncbi:hypothetical protein [Tsukamurella sp. USMM236]